MRKKTPPILAKIPENRQHSTAIDHNTLKSPQVGLGESAIYSSILYSMILRHPTGVCIYSKCSEGYSVIVHSRHLQNTTLPKSGDERKEEDSSTAMQ